MRKLLAGALVAAALLAPTAAQADDSARAGVEDCREYGGGYWGVWAWYYDLNGRYHRVWTCIYTGP